MKFQIGDTILITHSNEEGEVINIINNEMVTVEVSGVQFPIYIDQIDFPYFKRFTEKKKSTEHPVKLYIDQIPIEKKQAKNRTSKGIVMQCIPTFELNELSEEIIKELKLYLINQTDQSLLFTYQLHFFGKSSFELNSEIAAFNTFYLHNIPFEDWNDSPAFSFNFFLTQLLPNKASSFNTILRIKPKQLFSKIENMKAQNEPWLTFSLFEFLPDKKEEEILPISTIKKTLDVSKIKKHIEPPRTIIDLHIEKLIEDWQHLDNFEILQIQLQTFEKYYDLALLHYQPSLIVIHGVGTGRLRNEIHDILKTKKEVKSFVNQYDHRFGYGATEITLQY